MAKASGRDPYIALLEYDAYFGVRKVTCTAADEQTFEIHSIFDTGLATTGPREPKGYSTALRRNRRCATTETPKLLPVSQSETSYC